MHRIKLVGNFTMDATHSADAAQPNQSGHAV